MNKKQKQEEKLRENLIPILIGVTIFVLSLTVFRPILMQISELRLENARLKKSLTGLERKSQLLYSLDEEEVSRRAIKLEEVFPSEKPVLNLIASLVQLAKEDGVAFSGVGLTPGKISPSEKKEGKLKDFNISFNIDGKLADVTSFITDLEKTAPLMKIEDISLNLEGRASLGVLVYYQDLPETLGTIDQEVPLLSEKEKIILEEISDYRRIEAIKTTAPTGKENLFSLP